MAGITTNRLVYLLSFLKINVLLMYSSLKSDFSVVETLSCQQEHLCVQTINHGKN